MPQDLIAENQMGNDKAQEVQKLLNSLETMEFGLNYPQDSIENRIARLETKIFNNVSSNDPTIERLERLVAVQEAQPSSQEINQQAGTLPKKVFTSRVTQIGTIIFILLSLIL